MWADGHIRFCAFRNGWNPANHEMVLLKYSGLTSPRLCLLVAKGEESPDPRENPLRLSVLHYLCGA